MTTTHRRRLTTGLALAALLGACSGGGDADPSVPLTIVVPTLAPSSAAPDSAPPATSDGPVEAWQADTDLCRDPARATSPITGTVRVGSVIPQSGGPISVPFAPLVDGLRAYVQYANENRLLGDVTIELNIGDDQYSPDRTPGVVDELLDSGVQVMAGIVGSTANDLVADQLDDECVPHLMALTTAPDDLGDRAWVVNGLTPVDIEVRAYLATMRDLLPDGSTIGTFTVNNDYGNAYLDALDEHAGEFGFQIVESQSIEITQVLPPAEQVAAIAGDRPDVVFAAPLSTQCGTFLSEMVTARTVDAAWRPPVFVADACSSVSSLRLAGIGADGMYTIATAGLADVDDERVVRNDPAVAAYVRYLDTLGLADEAPSAALGWTVGEVTIEAMRRAQASPAGLTQASIIEAARSLRYEPTLARDGIAYTTAGTADPVLVDAVQVVRYDAEKGRFRAVGPVIG